MVKTSSLREPLGFFEIADVDQCCKFCGCSDHRPCFIPPSFIPGAVAAVTCAWILEDVCSAPACVEKAYAEARPLAEQIDEALRLEWEHVA